MVEQRIIFNSSLPRTGSTLLQNILAQNPRFYCSPTSGVFELLLSSRDLYGELPMFKAQDPEVMKKGFLGYCRAALAGYYSAITDKPVCVDKSRGWVFHYDWLKQFHPDPKIIVCVRDLRAILSSMEKLFRKNAHLQSPGDSPSSLAMVTVQARVLNWLNSAPVGFTLRRLIDAVERGNHRHCHIVRFEELTTDPRRVLQGLYSYLGEPAFDHDFDHVAQLTSEDDAQYPVYGDHKIREKIAPVPEDFVKVLTKPICDAIRADNSLYYDTFYRGRP